MYSIIVLPSIPTGVQIIDRDDRMVTLAWDTPESNDYYTITISPAPLSHPMFIRVDSSPWNILLNGSIDTYILNISAVDCNGESNPFTLNINFSKLNTWGL